MDQGEQKPDCNEVFKRRGIRHSEYRQLFGRNFAFKKIWHIFSLASDILTKCTTHHGKVSHSKSIAFQDSHEKGHLEFFHTKISHEKIETIYFLLLKTGKHTFQIKTDPNINQIELWCKFWTINIALFYSRYPIFVELWTQEWNINHRRERKEK